MLARKPDIIQLKWWHWLFLLLLDIMGPFASDALIPSLPDIQDEMNSTDYQTSLLLNLNWSTEGLAALVLGHLSDRLGRRIVAICGMLIFIIGSLCCSETRTIHVLIWGRFVQALGEGSSHITDAVTRDVLDDPIQRMRMISILSTLRPFFIIVAPTIGGFISSAIGWRWLFRVLTFWGVLCLVLAFTMPETNPVKPRFKFAQLRTYLYLNLRRLFSSRL